MYHFDVIASLILPIAQYYPVFNSKVNFDTLTKNLSCIPKCHSALKEWNLV
jgi:hypothetical protein